MAFEEVEPNARISYRFIFMQLFLTSVLFWMIWAQWFKPSPLE